jgi:hypothetical protein
MNDILYLILLLIFFGVTAGFLVLCQRLMEEKA